MNFSFPGVNLHRPPFIRDVLWTIVVGNDVFVCFPLNYRPTNSEKSIILKDLETS